MCGWNARENMYDIADDSPSLGETRAADIPPGGYGVSGPTSQAARGSRMSPYPTEARPTASVGGATSGGRFCGACGARLESGMAFCGQCGSPVAATSDSGLTFGASGLRTTAQEQYRVGGWPDDDGNELTEAIPGATGYNNGFGRSGAGLGLQYGGVPYHPTGYVPASGATPTSSSRTARLAVGVLCLIGSVISASAAIILALSMGH
ncbi:MAG TPA: zinc ribbon domain-containing protein [Ktedonobacterales bacterium]|nr:zinc ribbon domain-containing protein [Ktedonobacterales bacterium]